MENIKPWLCKMSRNQLEGTNDSRKREWEKKKEKINYLFDISSSRQMKTISSRYNALFLNINVSKNHSAVFLSVISDLITLQLIIRQI